ncbi:hypothetical protein P618_200152 [Holospora obtusa F1]|uniref:Uncharacterized protein n=1 Tax=Holospora obtusa F1 TaxID=1399147 RepID=W6TEG9_HOLOB|nr:hypothetical protein [Holospora obtusa]ETZ07648.1 hypothetical protein P618_200152 [Holospora obtusa F1]
MTKAEIYQEIRNGAPMYYGEAPELLEALEELENQELLEDLDALYQEWSSLPKLYCTDDENELKHIEECEALFSFLTEAIFNHGDPSVIPHLLKYVPSDDDDKDSVFMEDYSSEQICNGICSARYFGESYIPVLLSCIHELVPRAMGAARWFFYSMLYDNFENFLNNQPLVKNLRMVQKDLFKEILQSCIQEITEKFQKSKKEANIKSIKSSQEDLERIERVHQEFLKICEQ